MPVAYKAAPYPKTLALPDATAVAGATVVTPGDGRRSLRLMPAIEQTVPMRVNASRTCRLVMPDPFRGAFFTPNSPLDVRLLLLFFTLRAIDESLAHNVAREMPDDRPA